MSYELEPALARRFVRILERAGKSWNGAGTGFWQAPDLVLTAWHVVEEAHAAGRALGVLPDGWKGDPLPARVLWPETPPGENGLDAALLRLEEGADRLLSHPRLRSTLLGPGQEWRSKGWPVAVPEEYDWADLRGKTGALQGDQETLEVYVEGAPKTAGEWQGISGAAAFVAGEWVGVVKESTESWDGRRLYLVTSAALLAAPGFREALGEDPAQQRCRQLQEQVRNHFRANLEAARALREAARSRGQADWPVVTRAEEVDSFVAALCNAPLAGVLGAANEAHRTLLREAARANPAATGTVAREAARAIKELVLSLGPLLHERSRTFLLGPGEGSVWRLPLRRETLIELAMAGFQDRPMAVRAPERKAEHAKPLASLSEPAFDRSIDGGAVETFRLFAQGLAGTYADGEIYELLGDSGRFRAEVTEKAADREAFKLTPSGQALAALNYRFHYLAHEDDDPLQHYLILSKLSPSGEGRELVELIVRHLPDLPVLFPEGNLAEDDQVLQYFNAILFRHQEAERGSA
ncbi:MAG: hypothetical protein U0002_14225 [Thermoanaerobaculia bacterium]